MESMHIINRCRALASGACLRILAAIGAFWLCCLVPAAASTLHPGDRVDVVVFYHPELSSTVTLNSDGTIQLPVAGTISSEGLKTEELARRIEARLSKYVQNPAVRVVLTAQGDTIFVAGGPSGVLHYMPGETLTSIADQLQFSPTQRAVPATVNAYDTAGKPEQVSAQPLDIFEGPVDFKRVSVLRDGKEFGPYDVIALRGAGQPGMVLAPGDTVQLVNKPVAVTVHGEVAQPGPVYLYPEDPLARAIDQAGGTTTTGSQTQITLVRGGTAQLVSLGSPAFSTPAVNGDIVTVPRAPRVDVLGTVVKPGETYLRGNQTLVSAIYYAGGPDKYANLKSVQVLRNGVKTEYNLAHLQKGHAGDNPPLVDGDVVFVPQGSTIDALTIFQALATLGFLAEYR
jgi:polysaccharide export outer membrane protein